MEFRNLQVHWHIAFKDSNNYREGIPSRTELKLSQVKIYIDKKNEYFEKCRLCRYK